MCRGSLIGHPVEHVRIVLTDGASHAVDSSELAFKLAAIYAFRKVLAISFHWSDSLNNWFSPYSLCLYDILLATKLSPLGLLFILRSEIFKQCYTAARPVILEPVMLVELKVPIEFQGTVAGDLNKWVFSTTFMKYAIFSWIIEMYGLITNLLTCVG